MKKLKLLSSLSALVLVLSVGACNNNSNDDVTEDSSSSSSVTEEVTLNNYTLSFSFVDATGAASTIPEYATAYVIGSWDSWGQFIPLTETEGRYSTTFSTIKEGSYTYKVVEWYTDETVDWSNCVEITTTDQTVVVNASDGDNFTNTITHTLSAVLEKLGVLEGEEALTEAAAILAAIPEGTYLEELWDNVHVEGDGDGEHDSLWLSDTFEHVVYIEGSLEWDEETFFGVWINDDTDEEETTYKYYKEGLCYTVDFEEGEPTVSISSNQNACTGDLIANSEDLLDGYSEPLIEASGFTDEIIAGETDDGETVEFTVTRNAGSLELTISIEDWGTYSYTTDRNYNLTSYAYDDNEGSESYTVEKTTKEAITSRMYATQAEIDVAIDPDSLLEQIYEDCNYMVRYDYSEYVSSETVTYGDYKAAIDAYDEDEGSAYNEIIDKLESSEELYDCWRLYLYYTEDAILVQYYEAQFACGTYGPGYYYFYMGSELIVNGTIDGEDVFYDFWSDDGEEAEWTLEVTDSDGEHLYDAIYEGSWQDYYWSLADAYEMGVTDPDNMYMYGYGSSSGGFTAYMPYYYSTIANLFKCSGGQFLFGDDYNDYFADIMDIYNYFYYFPNYKQFQAYFYYGGFSYYGKDLTAETELFLDEMYIDVVVSCAEEIDLSEEIATAFGTED